MLNEDDFIKAIEDYIEKASPARQTAQDYIRDVKSFFSMLYEEYGIRNAVFYDNEILAKFEKMTKPVIEKLREQENRECISDNDYEKLESDITEFLSKENLEELILQDIEENYSKENKKSRYYSRFVSILPLKLAMKYALSNTTMTKIQLSDLDMEKKILLVNGFELELSEELINLFSVYLSMRARIIDLNHVKTDYLFLKLDGSSFMTRSQKNAGQPNSTAFFFLMKESIGTNACKKLSYKRIVELVQKGVNINVLSDLVEVTVPTIKKICNLDTSIEKKELIDKISDKSFESERKPIIPKGMMKCVYCGNVTDSAADNWVLIQRTDAAEKHLACRKCRGKDGKFRY